MFKTLRQSIANIIYPSQKNSMSLPQQFLRYGSRGMEANWTEVLMNDKDSYSGYGYAAIKKRANIVSNLAGDNVITDSNIDGYTHPYLEIISLSRDFTDDEFWRQISTYLDIEGIYYLMAVRANNGSRIGAVKEFKLLNPFNIRRVINGDSLEVGGYIENRDGFQREIPKNMIIEIKELNPFSYTDPYSLVDAAKESQFTLKTAGDYTRNALKHNINAPGILTTDVVLDHVDFKNFAERVKNHKKGEPVFGNGSGAIKWQDMSTDLSKAALKDINETNRDLLFSVAGMSKTMMGIEQSGTTRDTADVQQDLHTDTEAIPRIKLILGSLNQDYKNNYPDEFNRTKALLKVINPSSTDHEADFKEAEAKTKKTELFNMLVDRGYKPDVVADYVDGRIGLDMLGIPTPPKVEPVAVVEKEEAVHDHDRHLQDERSGLISQQEGSLRNAVTNVEDRIVSVVIKNISNKAQNQYEEEKEIISKKDKNEFTNDLELALLAFYGIIMSLHGSEVMRDRVGEFALAGTFVINKEIRNYIKTMADKVATSHVETVLNDILVIARESALQGKSQIEIVNDIKQKYSKTITETRAKTIARTETNRAFTRAQYEADKQLIDQNNLTKRAYKIWRTRSDNPCNFCKELASRGKIPFTENFVDLGNDIEVDGKRLKVGFESLQAGNAHPNCACEYELIIESQDNDVTDLLKQKEADLQAIEQELDKYLAS